MDLFPTRLFRLTYLSFSEYAARSFETCALSHPKGCRWQQFDLYQGRGLFQRATSFMRSTVSRRCAMRPAIRCFLLAPELSSTPLFAGADDSANSSVTSTSGELIFSSRACYEFVDENGLETDDALTMRRLQLHPAPQSKWGARCTAYGIASPWNHLPLSRTCLRHWNLSSVLMEARANFGAYLASSSRSDYPR